MPQCCVPYCSHRSETKQYFELSFYRFPCDEEEKKRWLQLIRRENYIPNCNARVCSWHFPNGKQAGPTRFAWNEGGTFLLPDQSSNPPTQKKQLAPTGGEDGGTDQPQDPSAHPTIMDLPSKRCYCSVPFCQNTTLKCPSLSFHEFPSDAEMCARWLRAIKREKGPTFKYYLGGCYVCDRHFGPEDTEISDQGEIQLKQGAVPSRFLWNDWGYGDSDDWESLYHWSRKPFHSAVTDDSGEISVPEDSTEEPPPTDVVARDHDYACHRPAGTLESANQRIEELELQVLTLKIELEQLTAKTEKPMIFKFCNTDEDFKHYTRFSSKEVFSVFWESVYPSDSRLVYWSKAQRTAPETPSTQRELPLVDELFMFLCRIAAGLQEKTLSSIFEVSLSTVRCTILTWTSYLYQVLGSLPLWMTREQVEATMPHKYRLSCPGGRVVIDSTEILCETASSLSLQSEKVPDCKNHTSFKGLIGVAPCGVITFVSKLYTGSISDEELTQKSQILQLIEPGDRVVTHKSFQIKEMLSKVGATLIISPPKKPPQASMGDYRFQTCSRLGTLAEKAIRRVKEYHIWSGPVPLSMVGSVNQLWVICCLMSNYQGALSIKPDRPV